MTKTLYVRPITESDLNALRLLSDDPDEASVYGFFGYRDPASLRQNFEEGFIQQDRGRLAVAVGSSRESSECIGDLSWHKVPTGPTCFSWNIGIGLLTKARGHGYGTRAQRLLAEYLFAHTQVNRIEASTEVDNIAERRSLEKAGFTYEGVLRGAMFRGGKWRDMAGYSILRSDVQLD